MTYPMKVTPTSWHQRLLSIASGLICGVFIAGRLHFQRWCHEFERYRDVTEAGTMVSVLYETVYLLLGILVGGYGSYAVCRDFLVPMFRQQTKKQSRALG